MKSNCFVWIFFMLPIVISQNVCDITWKVLNNTNFRNAFRANIQPSIQGCLDECQAFSACLAVDIDLRNSGDDYYICWYHSNPKDIEANYSYAGLNAYIKTVNCSKNASYEGSVGDTGYPGSPGPTGNTGPPGNPGVPGIAGFIGPTGNMGMAGATGQPGQRGNAGPTGPGGATGSKGRIGDTGPTGSIGAQGPPGDTAFSSANSSFYIRAVCPPLWSVYNNSQSNGSIPFPFPVNSVDQCKDVCLSYPNCVAMEFSTINSSCRIHNTSNNLSDKISSSIFDQYVRDSRCDWGSTLITTGDGNGGQPGELGLSGSSGMTGQPGIRGATGVTGSMGQIGSTGPAGSTGTWGMAGMTGLYGPSGNTGSIGDTGSTGPLGLAGAIRIVASNGSSYNIKDSCQPQWVTLEGFRSRVNGSTPVNYDPDTCKVNCLNDTSCVAFDYNVKKSTCQRISNVIDLIDKVADDDTNQYVLLSKCPTAFNFTSPIQVSPPIPLKRKEKNSKHHGNGYDNDDDEYGDDDDNDDDDDDDDCVSLDLEEGALSDPELCALFVAPPLTILVNILCWLLHSGGRKIANWWRMDGWSVEKLNDDDDDDDEKIIEI